ncbi:MAG TPA: stage III sporulation protein AA [Bacillota bacterium]|nr:stage III sporulation protein AA [Bacillota bacterium]HPT87362.1 stage III sporulation protein AA [Bacillota bacterium]
MKKWEEMTPNLPTEIKSSWQQVLRFFPVDFRQILSGIGPKIYREISEIRFRINQPLEVVYQKRSMWVASDGRLVDSPEHAHWLRAEDIGKIVNALTAGSIYALEEELTKGYITLPGGHRVGFTGHVVSEAGRIRLIRNISSLNFRIARACLGIARPILPYLWKDGRFLKTMILSPPACGKTTLLREIVREISNGVAELGIPGLHVGVVDERSEIAGSFQGTPQLDVGLRTDVLDACNKGEGVYLLLRSMNPDVIATDEIGAENDFEVLEDIINAGVSMIVTAHAMNLTEAMCRPGLRRILERGMIERLIILSSRSGAGTLESVRAGVAGPELLRRSSVTEEPKC